MIASEASAREMSEVPASQLAAIMAQARAMGPAGQYLVDIFGSFDFTDVAEKLPTQTFAGEFSLTVGDKKVDLIEVGPAHTAGDILVHVPGDKTVFTGDILFIEGTPIMWAGPIGNWIDACDLIIEDLHPDVVVPGHGPVTDVDGVRTMRDYLVFVDAQARARHADGMPLEEAIRDIALGEFAGWIDRERLAVNVDSVYRELDPERGHTDVVTLFGLMASLAP